MVRLTRIQQQARTRAAVLDAAVEEFAEHGYADAKIDRIAARADLTRGAVYSNFAGKRSLYLAVLLGYPQPQGWSMPAAELPESVPVTTAVEGFARAWLEHLPLAGDTSAGGRLRSRSVTGVFDDEPGRAALTAITRLEALLLALALESCPPVATRRVRLAELVLTLLHGADHLADTAPGFGDLFDLTRACAHLAGITLDDSWDPPHLPFVPPAELCDVPWEPADGITDDGLLVVLGTARLGAAEEVVRAAGPGDRVTVAVVSGDPAETGALVRLRLTAMAACLRQALPPGVARPLHIELDDGPALAAAVAASSPGLAAQDDVRGDDTAATARGDVLGAAAEAAAGGGVFGDDDQVAAKVDETEVAVRIRDGRVVARASGRGAGHAVAVALRDGGTGGVDGRD
ncbi:TetR/AcrR family transcriptional regulator [Actinoplanes sp. NPDC026670]|uniref:TetR/AcrR family transcriptional regulator n=1 Tax=Actinoplanes sp. NPDC026670 TaxID=3154700 RepID=UPI0033F120E1